MQLSVSKKEINKRFSYSPLAVITTPPSKAVVVAIKNNFFITKFLTMSLFASLSIDVLAQQLPRITQFAEAEVKIVLDGFVDETVWQRVPVVDGMKIVEPDTLEYAPYITDIMFFYTERGL